MNPNQRNRNIPGSIKVEGREFRYVAYTSDEPFKDFFSKLINESTPFIPTSGGVISNACTITIPSGDVYYSISYKGDIKGWREQIENSAKILNAKIAILKDNYIIIHTNEKIHLSDCQVNFY